MSLIKKAALPALGLLIIANFVGYAVVGDNGVLSWGDYRRTKTERSTQLATLEAERERLAHRAQLLDPNNTDPDLVEEMVRSDLGYLRPDEIVIEIPPEAAAQGQARSQARPQPRR